MLHRRSIGRRTAPILLLLVLATGLGGCALLDFGGERRRQELLADGMGSLERGDCETAYERFKELRTGHPGSEEARKAFPAAANCLKRLYYLHRYRDPDSPFLHAEQRFVFEWLADFYGDDEDLATRRTKNVFLSAPYGLYRSFEEYAEGHPTFSHWDIRVEEDNGIVETVTVQRIRTAVP